MAPFSFLPPWSKPHIPSLKHASTYQGSSRPDLDAESSSRDRHQAGVRRNDGSGEHAGYGHIGQVDYEEIEKRIASVGRWEADELRAVGNKYLVGEDVAETLEGLFKDENVVVSVRDIKQLIAPLKLENPLRHGKARFVLPVSEDDIKNQKWNGRKEDSEEPKTQESDGTNDESQSTESEEKMDPKEQRFFDALMEEGQHFEDLKNHPGTILKLDAEYQADVDDEQVSIGLQVDDQFTPDSWVPRSSHLLRVAGKHPLNAEPSLTDLFDAGFVTPVKYHFVRNHAAVPRLQYETHTLSVTNLAGDETVFSMKQIQEEFDPIELLVTIACDGNRRGEVNLEKKSSAYGWSCTAVSTCRWTGARMRDVLLRCGVPDNDGTAEKLYLNYEGADEPAEGAYATSIPLEVAMASTNDNLLAYRINGRLLHPDHGYPLRSIIPGYVGGRNVKWLKKLWISREPNRSHYHIWDNKVVPSFITDKNTAIGKAFFHHPGTALYEQTLQSIICKPAHGEHISLVGEKGLKETYSVQGFAYSGAGLLIRRVELSLDGGQSWKYCFRRVPDSSLRHGSKFWAWIHWSCEVEVSELANSSEMMVRAWDGPHNTQPDHLTWNFMGMMNNSIYRVRGHLASDPGTHEPSIRFLHPVAPGVVEGGWKRPSKEQTVLEKAKAEASTDTKEFTLAEVEKHNHESDAWIILDNKVYDVTSVLSWHPGGAHAILAYAGRATIEATTSYANIHDGYANSQRDKLLIGRLGEKGANALKEDSLRAAEEDKKTKEERSKFALTPFRYVPATLIKKKILNKDTRVYTFKLPAVHGNAKVGLPVGKHLQCALHFKDGVVLRNYTPTRPVLEEEEDGTFDLLIKSYFPNASPFLPGGTMGNYLDVMQIGEELDVKGPAGEIEYCGNGNFKIGRDEYHFDKINLVAGGSGLTPHWQLIHKILSTSNDPTRISLINSNKTFDDVLLFDELEQYKEQERGAGDKSRFSLYQTLTGGETGREGMGLRDGEIG